MTLLHLQIKLLLAEKRWLSQKKAILRRHAYLKTQPQNMATLQKCMQLSRQVLYRRKLFTIINERATAKMCRFQLIAA